MLFFLDLPRYFYSQGVSWLENFKIFFRSPGICLVWEVAAVYTFDLKLLWQRELWLQVFGQWTFPALHPIYG